MRLFSRKKISPEEKYLELVFKEFEGIRDGDVFLVGFPKSGNTWIRFLFGNYLSDGKCSFVNSHEIVPGLIEHPQICNALESPRFISTHFTEQSFEKLVAWYKTKRKAKFKIIFIVRDGRDVAMSYYYHLRKHKKLDDSAALDQFLIQLNKGEFNPYVSWSQYNLDWSRLGAQKYDIKVVTYESLLDDPARVMHDVFAFLKVELNAERLNVAIEASSFDNMQQMEEEESDRHFRFKNSNREIKFVRSGSAGGWQKELTGKALSEFYAGNTDALKAFNYI